VDPAYGVADRSVEDAVVSIDELRDRTNSHAIYANEQIPEERIPN
jgi:hypothetical protein